MKPEEPELIVKCHRCGYVLYAGSVGEYAFSMQERIPEYCPNCGRRLALKPRTVKITARPTGETACFSLDEYIREPHRRRFMEAEEV